MVTNTIDIHTEPCIIKPRLTEAKRLAIIQKIEETMAWGFGAVEFVIVDHRIKTVYQKKTTNEEHLG